MTPPKSKRDGDRAPQGNPTQRGRKTPPPDKNLNRTGELSIEQYRQWLANREAASRTKGSPDKDGGAPD